MNFKFFDVLIEIPKGSKNKYEFDKKKNIIRLNRVLYSSLVYPIDYGYIIDTLEVDGDSLDALIFMTNPAIPGCLIKVRPIGILFMIDNNFTDDKILCVPKKDPNYNSIKEIDQINSHKKREIEHFFSVYKDLEKKKVVLKGWGNSNEAIKKYKKSLIRYKNSLSTNINLKNT